MNFVKIDSIEKFDFKGNIYNMHLESREENDDLFWIVHDSGVVTHNCFGKDVRALYYTSKNVGSESQILKSVTEVNDERPYALIKKWHKEQDFKKVAIWGLAFKPETDDIREASSLKMIEYLLDNNIDVNVYDPMAMDNVKSIFGDKISYHEDEYSCLKDVDCLILCTEWRQFRAVDFDKMKELMNQHYIFDGRNQYKLDKMKTSGFKYYSIGRPAIL